MTATGLASDCLIQEAHRLNLCCVYGMNDGSAIRLVYEDDILTSISGEFKIDEVIYKFKSRFQTVGLSGTNSLLGIQITCDDDAGSVTLTQEGYAKSIIKTYGMSDPRPLKTPVQGEGTIEILKKGVMPPKDTGYYRSVTGGLLYLSRFTRPDTTHVVMVLTRSMSTPGPNAFVRLKRAM